jgi:protein-tyrosine phosphatase
MFWVTKQVAVSGAQISPDNCYEYFDQEGITAVVNLRLEYQDFFGPPLPLAYLWLPVVDFTNPSMEQLLLGTQFIETAVKTGGRVLVHCRLGVGRSPTMAAAYLVRTGLSVDEAVQRTIKASGKDYSPIINSGALEEFAAVLKEINEPV